MRYLNSYTELNEGFINNIKIKIICKKYNIEKYTINPDGSIDVDGSIHLFNKNLTKLPLKFNKINGIFSCSYNKLTSLEGSPVEINGHFYCRDNKLTSFKGAPKIINGGFVCDNNKIKSFEYFPSFIEDDFVCWVNPIFEVWDLFQDTTKIELLNDFDIFRDEDTDTPAIIMDRLNDFLLTIGKEPVENLNRYKII